MYSFVDHFTKVPLNLFSACDLLDTPWQHVWLNHTFLIVQLSQNIFQNPKSRYKHILYDCNIHLLRSNILWRLLWCSLLSQINNIWIGKSKTYSIGIRNWTVSGGCSFPGLTRVKNQLGLKSLNWGLPSWYRGCLQTKCPCHSNVIMRK